MSVGSARPAAEGSRSSAARRSAALLGLFGGVGLASFGGCFTGSDGLVPPARDLYFPTALAVSPGRTTLYVANSDFDLQYSGGTIQALNLATAGDQPGLRELAEKVAQKVADGAAPAEVCGAIGAKPNTVPSLYPGPCDAIDATPFVRAFAGVGAFSSGMTLVPRQGEAGLRLFLSVRGDPSVTYFDVVDDRDPAAIVSPCESDFCLACGADGDDQRCSDRNRIGENIFTSQRGLLMPTEPTGVASAVHASGDAIVMPHQTSATASLVINHWPANGDTAPFSATPSLEFLLEKLPEAPTGIVAIPAPAVAAVANVPYQPGFVISHRATPSLSVLRYVDDSGAAPPRPFLVRSEDIAVTLSNDGSDSRGLAFDTTARDACEAACADALCPDGGDSCAFDVGYRDCLLACAEEPIGFYVASRSPAALLSGTLAVEPVYEGQKLTGLREKISLDESITLPLGPSMVAVGRVVGAGGSLEPRVFAVSFDARFITVYDPELRRIESTMRTGRGPVGIAFDTDPVAGTSYMYVSQFTDSYLSVVDLDSRRLSYATPIVSVGPPLAPREEQ